MRGRLENKIKTEAHIQKKIEDMPEYMKRFYYSLKNKSHTTKERYINNVIRFLDKTFDGDFPELEELNEIDSYTVQMYMSDIGLYESDGEYKELKESTQCTIYSCLCAFFDFLDRENYIMNNPFSNHKIERPKIKDNSVVFLTPEEVRRVEKEILDGTGNAMSVGKQRNWKYRDLLLFRIPVVNGLRVTALSEINLEDIDLINKKITVTEKGNITKRVDFDPKTSRYLKIWLDQRKKLLGDVQENALFISNQRKRMTVRSIENVIGKYTECIPNKHITPHKLRSTCGTNTYQQTKDIYLVSKVLGHKTTSPTKRYAAVFDEDITNTINTLASMY